MLFIMNNDVLCMCETRCDDTDMKQYSDTSHLINETQAGFRQAYSILDHVFLLKCVIDLFKWRKRKLSCLFVDYRKAFDMVWREGLWHKLVRDNVNG